MTSDDQVDAGVMRRFVEWMNTPVFGDKTPAPYLTRWGALLYLILIGGPIVVILSAA